MKIAYSHLVQYIEEKPSIEQISNGLAIINTSITDFQGLNNLSSIVILTIEDNALIQNFEGFDSLTTVNQFVCDSNGILNFQGLDNLEFIFENFICFKRMKTVFETECFPDVCPEPVLVNRSLLVVLENGIAKDAVSDLLRHASQKLSAQPSVLLENGTFFECFPYDCPEPVLVK